MTAILTTDPIMSVDRVCVLAKIKDQEVATELINIVSQKFLDFTNRVQINEAAVTEQTCALDGNAAFVHSPPIKTGVNVTVTETTRSDPSEATTYSEDEAELIVDRVRGSIYKVGGTWENGQGFPSLTLVYTGGWATVPAGVEAGALAQMKVELQRIKGAVGHDSVSTAGDTVVPDRSGVVKEAEEAWNRYRIMV